MSNNDLILYIAIGAIFFAVMLSVLAAGRFYSEQQVRRRVVQVTSRKLTTGTSFISGISNKRINKLIESLSNLSVLGDGWKDSKFRTRFIQAGYRSDQAPRIFLAIKSLCLLGFPIITFFALAFFVPQLEKLRLLMWVGVAAAAGYYLPEWTLKWITARRAKGMRNALPDLVDLLAICVESGLGLDSALHRVSKEMGRSNKDIAEEFYLTGLEIRAGAGRADALRDLGLRVNLEDLKSLISMLIQSDRFGTSLTDALKVHAEVMRVKRMQRAEEQAAKVPVKMVFPLVLCILPALLIVLLGPAFIGIYDAFVK